MATIHWLTVRSHSNSPKSDRLGSCVASSVISLYSGYSGYRIMLCIVAKPAANSFANSSIFTLQPGRWKCRLSPTVGSLVTWGNLPFCKIRRTLSSTSNRYRRCRCRCKWYRPCNQALRPSSIGRMWSTSLQGPYVWTNYWLGSKNNEWLRKSPGVFSTPFVRESRHSKDIQNPFVVFKV